METGADVLVISSLNGEAEGWGREVRLLKTNYRTLDDLVMMIGGNLVVIFVGMKQVVVVNGILLIKIVLQ